MIPAAVTFVPSFIIISEIGWLNTLPGPDRAGHVRRRSPRSCSGSTSSASRSSWRKPPASTASRRGAPTGGSSCPTPRGSSPPSPRSRSSPVGTRSCGRSSSVATATSGRCRWRCRRSSTRRAPKMSPVVHRLGDRHPPARARLRAAPALDRRGRRAHRHQRLIATDRRNRWAPAGPYGHVVAHRLPGGSWSAALDAAAQGGEAQRHADAPTITMATSALAEVVPRPSRRRRASAAPRAGR